jgi:SAM-dependent methyltransferase
VPMDLDEYRKMSLETWQQTASGWEQRHDWVAAATGMVTDWVFENADPQPGQTILDIAGGTGALGLRLAAAVGDDGRLIATDFAPEMVEAAKRNAEAAGATNVEHRVLDAERMDLDDDSVDGVTCRFGYMLMADPGLALKETRRVLREGGPLSFAVWATPDRNPWAAVPAMTLVQLGHVPPPEPGAPGIFALGAQDRIRELVQGAGFGDPRVEEIPFEFHYADEGDLWDTLVGLSGGMSRAIKALPEDEQAAARAAVVENMAAFRQDDGSYRAPALALGVLAR